MFIWQEKRAGAIHNFQLNHPIGLSEDSPESFIPFLIYHTL